VTRKAEIRSQEQGRINICSGRQSKGKIFQSAQYTITIGLTLFLILMLSGCRQPAEKKTGEQEKKDYAGIIVAVGDSLTAGLGVAEEDNYPTQLQRRLDAEGLRYRVINSGVSGETSSGALSRLNWILSLKPDIVILETGANDGLRGVDPELTRKNIEKIVATLQEKKIITILAGMRMVGNLGLGYTDPFRQLYLDVAKESGVIFMPFFLEGVATDQALNISDGIHPNRQGYEIIVNNLLPCVLRAIDLKKKGR
jgi:acyl-CoA thioesterase I